jgi:hypothetical protein
MQAFIAKYHKMLFGIAVTAIVAAAFYTGFLEGNRTASNQPVTLACSDNVLDKLSIPVQALANSVTALADNNQPSSAKATAGEAGKYVGSKNSTKYYLPTCKAVKRIKPANYQWFSSAEDAQIQGYTPGKC